MLWKNGKQTRDFWGVFILVSYNFLYFGGVFNKTIIPFLLLDMRLVIAISYPTRAHGIIVKYAQQKSISRQNISRVQANSCGVKLQSHEPSRS